MDGVIASVKRGGTIAAPLAQAPIFPAMVTHMVGVGEETGALDQMLSRIAEFYEEDVQNALATAMALIEPVILIVMGVVVAFVLISLYLPIFSMGVGGIH